MLTTDKTNHISSLSESMHKEVIAAIEKEHTVFREYMMQCIPTKIYDSCNKIRFYECMYEYFSYNDNISNNFYTKAYEYLLHGQSIIEYLYCLYLKYEMLSVDSWDCINELIHVFAQNEL